MAQPFKSPMTHIIRDFSNTAPIQDPVIVDAVLQTDLADFHKALHLKDIQPMHMVLRKCPGLSFAYSNVDCTINLYHVHCMPLLMHSSSQTCNLDNFDQAWAIFANLLPTSALMERSELCMLPKCLEVGDLLNLIMMLCHLHRVSATYKCCL